jgi:L-lactate dehydrogenase (cytochrome)
MVDVERRDLSTEVLGQRLALPVLLGPAGLQGLVHRRGELAASAAASRAGTAYVLSIGSSYSIEQVREAADGNLWLQVSPWKDHSLLEGMIDRARACGYTTLCLTVDVPMAGKKDRDLRNGFSVPLKPTLRTVVDVALHPQWIPNVYFNLRWHHGNFPSDDQQGAVSIANWVNSMMNPAASWDEVRWLRSAWKGKIVVKGIMSADDARCARDEGADGVIVSNHGGRQLDGARATIEVLPEVVDAVAGDVDILLDGGIRRGGDVVKAIALGAKAALIGRPYVMSLAFGDEGPRRVLDILRREIDVTMALLGVTSWSMVGPEIVERATWT